MRVFLSFLSGFLATLLFHQPVLWLFNLAGIINRAPYAMEGTPPFGVPAVISLAFWGGIWGILLWLLIHRWKGGKYWLGAILFGAIAPTLVAGLVVAPLKGLPVAGGGDPSMILMGLAVNAAWGGGTALFLWFLIDRNAGAESGRTNLDASSRL